MTKGYKTGGTPSTGRTGSLTIRIQPELKEALAELAKRQGRTLSEVCVLALRDLVIEEAAREASAK
ncbi:MAG: ribbon-helix-helix protein, CopG family [Deltaproteobacteria bacterium]|nr:ribbon-helix-helix protein, CopG family [Deltaproteobacteria bacterium]